MRATGHQRLPFNAEPSEGYVVDDRGSEVFAEKNKIYYRHSCPDADKLEEVK
jgi:hypothetical protein